MEQTLVLIKPDAVKRNLIGEIVTRYERKGLRIVAMKLMTATEEIAGKHYEELQDKPFFGELVDFMVSGPLVAMIVEGPDAVVSVRALNGATNPVEALPGTIRGDYGLEVSANVVHGSDSVASAEREIGIWFA